MWSMFGIWDWITNVAMSFPLFAEEQIDAGFDHEGEGQESGECYTDPDPSSGVDWNDVEKSV